MRVGEKFRRLAIGLNSVVTERLDCHSRTDFVAEDWDTLVILDGARADVFQSQIDFPGSVEIRWSPGSDSSEFIESEFSARQLHDTVYVTANPYVHLLDGGEFNTVWNLLESDWDEETRTVLPEDATERALEAHQEFPNKRIIVHYMQPHYPFLGETGRQFDHGGIAAEEGENDGENPWFELIDRGEVSPEQVVDAYRENFGVVWPHVERLLENCKGRLVVTADHGNLIGERTWPIPIKTYGHPNGVRHQGLQQVPWAVFEAGDRREIVAEAPEGSEVVSGSEIEDQLEALGYR